MEALKSIQNAKNDGLEQQHQEKLNEKQRISKLSKKERKELKKKKKKEMKKALKKARKIEQRKKQKINAEKTKEDLKDDLEEDTNLTNDKETTEENSKQTANSNTELDDKKDTNDKSDKNDEDEEEQDFPLYNLLIHEKELDNTMFTYNQRQKLVDLKIYKVQPSDKYVKYIEFRCLHEDRIPGLIYVDGFDDTHKILVNLKTVELIRAQEKTDKTDEEIAKLYIKYYGDSSDVVLSLMGLDPFEMKKQKNKKKQFTPLPGHSKEDIEHEKQLDKMRFIHTEKNKAFNNIIKNMNQTMNN
tara:strand:- start:86 stop:985 length:900 start_codon:yes stop_codon:yes gene_type:complete